MALSQKARYLVSKRFIDLGATAVCNLTIRETKFVTITSTIWLAVGQMMNQPDAFLMEVASGYERGEYIGSQAFHLARDTLETTDLWSLTRRLDEILDEKAIHFDAIVCALLAVSDDSLSENPLPTAQSPW